MNDANTTPDQNSIYGDPYEILINHFRENELRFRHDPEKRTASLTMQSRSGVLLKCRFRFDGTGEVLQIDLQYPLMIEERFRTIVAEFLTRANRGLVVGGFQFDFEDGELIFHCSQILDEGKLTDEIIARLFRTSLTTSSRYWGGLMSVLYAGNTPRDAVDLCELYRFEDESEDEPQDFMAPEIIPPAKPKSAPRRARRKGAKGSGRKGQQDQTPQQDLPSQSASPSGERQERHPGTDAEGEDRKAA
jgi:hypothetical protein